MSKKTRTQKAETAIRQALRRLERSEGRVARQNARKALAQAIRRLKNATDAEYPTIRKKPKPGPAKLAPGHKINRLRKEGFRQVDVSFEAILRAAGVAVHKDPSGDRDPWTKRWAADLCELIRDRKIHDRTLLVPLFRDGIRSKAGRRYAEAVIHGRYAYRGPFVDSKARRHASARRRKLERLAKRNPEFRDAIIAAGRATDDVGELRGVLDGLTGMRVAA